jgi:murein DD-endopeptidase MepM/ murein hydrolase activator NlpD
MKQGYFIVVLAHSLHGRLRRIHIPHHVVYGVLALACLGCFTLLGVVSSYARMAWKVASYNSLRREVDTLRYSYQNLQKETDQKDQQLATLQILAKEISSAYGIKQKMEGPPDISSEGRLMPTFSETLEDYNFLKSASFSTFYHRYPRMWQTNTRPGIWPVDGRLLSPFGHRDDPFSGAMAFHAGVDISAGMGTPVRATADGVVAQAETSSGYGKLIVIDHGNGFRTYYAHLSRYDVVDGQEVRRGQIIGATGKTGRAVSPHLHYEVRMGGSPVNPYPFLAKTATASAPKKDFPF